MSLKSQTFTHSILPLGILALSLGCSADDPGDPSADQNTVTTDDGQGSVGGGNAGGGGPGGGGIGDGDEQPFVPIGDVASREPEACGNGQVDTEEACDDGNLESGDGCTADCQLVEPNWSCVEGFLCQYVHTCGDSAVGGGETCDDGNVIPGDGCSDQCFIETDWACPTPGEACIYVVDCGDANINGMETCDDANTMAGDGCSEICETEVGWECATPGSKCTSLCGDGLIVGLEDCDDGNDQGGDGCSATCRSEIGFECDTPGEACRATVCGDMVPEGGEPCDDGNNLLGDGCSPGCQGEPDCTGEDGCRSRCGDGLILPGDNEACDDGNVKNGDGCSSDCQVEMGFTCETVETTAGNTLTLPIVYRDFIGVGQASVINHDGATVQSYYAADGHPDFEEIEFSRTVSTYDVDEYNATGIVETQLGDDGRPVFAGSTPEAIDMVTSAETFASWFSDDPMWNVTLLDDLTLRRGGADEPYEFDSDAFFPLDGLEGTWVDQGVEENRAKDWDGQGCWNVLEDEQQCGSGCEIGGNPNESYQACTLSDNFEECVDYHNYSFTSELRYWFEYQGGEQLTFRGDDDVFVFINRRLVVDLGGLHEALGADVCGQVWGEAVRDPDAWLDPNADGFTHQPLRDADGDPIPDEPEEACAGLSAETTDVDGNNLNLVPGTVYEVALFQAERHTCQSNYRLTLSGFTQRSSECTSVCGDGIVASTEVCDDGEMNGAGYGYCTTECTPGPRCGDGVVDTTAGADGLPLEECDNGINGDGYFDEEGDCAPGCVYPPYCGDGQVDGAFAEQCDNGVDANDGRYGGCTGYCQLGPRCGDGIVEMGLDANGEPLEECDDGNRKNNDGCSVACKEEPRFTSR